MRKLALLLLVGACGGDLHSIQELMTDDMLYMVTVEAAPVEPVVGDVLLTIGVKDHNTMEPITEAALTVEPWMPAHDHGIQGDPVIQETGDGEYEVSFAFSMSGQWDVTIDVDASQGTDQCVASFDVQ